MNISRRAALVGAACLVTGCSGSPRVAAPDGMQRLAQPEPVQDPALAQAQAQVTGVRDAVAQEPQGPWRLAALEQLEAQVARFAYADPFATPEPVFTPALLPALPLSEAIARAVETLRTLGHASDTDSVTLLLLSASAATSALQNQAVLPALGGEPTWVETLAGQEAMALEQVWQLIAATELAIGTLRGEDELVQRLNLRLAQLKTLRGELRARLEDPPLQPAYFELPAMTSSEEIVASLATMEVALLESLVLAAAAGSSTDELWLSQVRVAQNAGGSIPRWPGWD